MSFAVQNQSQPLELTLKSGDEYSNLRVSTVRTITSAKGVYFKACQLVSVDLSTLSLPQLTLRECLVSNSEAAGLDCNSGFFEHSTFRNTRASGVQMYESKQKYVTYNDCKLDLANFSGSQLKKVRFENCLLYNVDFTNVLFDGVTFMGCELEKTNFSNARVKGLDLRSSRLSEVIGSASLKGALVTYDQLLELAPSLAQDIGLVIKDD